MSIKVIKSGNRGIINYRTKCSCGCQFEFNGKDISKGGFTGKYFVICPECGNFIYNKWFKWKKIR